MKERILEITNRITGSIKRRDFTAGELKIWLFGLTLAVFFVIGCLWFLRPDTSVLEKRELTKFPKITWSAFWDGDYLNQISTWYADTFPTREGLIAMDQNFEELYGFRSNQIVEGETEVAEDIPEEPEEEPIDEADENLPDGTITEKGEKSHSIYVDGNAGYELYYFTKDGVGAFTGALNKVAKRVGDKVNMYLVIAPSAAGVMLDDKLIEDMGASDQKKALNYLYGQVDDKVTCVPVIDRLRSHNAEYVYFRTDHHWTQRGAYYAYVNFCKAKDIKPHGLGDFETAEYKGFRGTFCQKVKKLKKHPDTVECFIPNGTNKMHLTNQNGDKYEWKIVNDVSDYDNTTLYGAFAGGDQPYAYAHNKKLDDNSRCLVIKDSFGNAFIPWLIDHYEYVYWIDIRYTHQTISKMVEKHHVQDVVYCFSIFNGSTKNIKDDLLRVGK